MNLSPRDRWEDPGPARWTVARPLPSGRWAAPQVQARAGSIRADVWAPPTTPPVEVALRPPEPGSVLRARPLEPPHRALRPVAWGRWPGYATRPTGRPVIDTGRARSAAAPTTTRVPARSVFEIDTSPTPEPSRLPATAADPEPAPEPAAAVVEPLATVTPLPAEPSSSAPDPESTTSSKRRPVWAWTAAAAVVGLAAGVVIAPQRSQAPDPVLVDDLADTGETGAGGITDEIVPTTTPLVAQLPPAAPVAGQDLTIQANFAGVGDDEWVVLTNRSGDALDMTGWQVSDDGRMHVYVFGPFVLPDGASVRLSSGCGADTPDARFWCSVDEVWNDSGDVLTVVTADGTLVATTTG